MKYSSFYITQYKGLKDGSIKIGDKPIPIIGLNESGKSSALEAICRFDFRNDEFAQNHHWEFHNRYNSSDKLFRVTTKVEFEQSEIETTLAGFTDQEMDVIRGFLEESGLALSITRFFQRPNDIFYSFNEQRDSAHETIIQKLVSTLPRVFYFDNFLEGQFPDAVNFAEYVAGTITDDTMNEYQKTIRIMFEKCGKNLTEFLGEDDCDMRKNILDDINKEISKTIVIDWKKMHVTSKYVDVSLQDLQIHLNQDADRHQIRINILEKFKDESGTVRDNTTPLSRRSLGFRWFFNFSIRKNFGSTEEKFLYLLDEPGSYLHNSAQSVLLKAIVEMAEINPVLYATHSEFLLDPDLININLVKVAEKKDRVIKLTPVSEVGDTRIDGALSTIYNALRIRTNLHSIIDKEVIVTEGITDFYFLKMILKDVVILPGFGAGQNQYLISMAIGCAKKYIALFDGDKEGTDSITKYKEMFTTEESSNWAQYTDSKDALIKLEKYFSKTDAKKLLELTSANNIKSGLTSLFYSDNVEGFWNGIDEESKANIKKLNDTLSEHLKLPNDSFLIK